MAPPTFTIHLEQGPAFEEYVRTAIASGGIPGIDVGAIGTDGGMNFMKPVRARRSGWARAVFSASGGYIFGLYGPYPDRRPHLLKRPPPLQG